MPNIKIKTEVKEQDLNDFMAEVDKQVREQTGRGYVWNINSIDGVKILHYDVEAVTEEVLVTAEEKIRRMYGNRVQVGKTGAYAVGRGKLQKALVIFLQQRGYGKIKFKGMF